MTKNLLPKSFTKTEEMQKLLEKLREEIKDKGVFEPKLIWVDEVLALLDTFKPKLEALLVSRRKLEKLIESFPKPKLERNQRYKCEIIMNPTAFANLCWRWKKDYLEKVTK